MIRQPLATIFDRRIDSLDLDARLEIVRFYINAERYDDAKAALKKTIRDFPTEKDLPPQLVAITEKQEINYSRRLEPFCSWSACLGQKYP